MSADIIAIGPFSADIADALEYPPDFYLQTKPGVPVVTNLFGMPGSTASREFAACLGIADPWDFNQHKIDPARVDLDALRIFLGTLAFAEEHLHDLDRFVRFREKGFEFYFRPNG